MAWWIWIVGGFALLTIELLTPTFFVFGFGIGALLVGLLAAAGLAEAVEVQGVLFAALSVLALLCFRRPIRNKLRPREAAGEVDGLVGEEAVALDAIDPGQVGSVELRGANWTARNSGQTVIGRAELCQVERVEGLTLWVKAG